MFHEEAECKGKGDKGAGIAACLLFMWTTLSEIQAGQGPIGTQWHPGGVVVGCWVMFLIV